MKQWRREAINLQCSNKSLLLFFGYLLSRIGTFGIYLPISLASDATMFPRTFIQSCGTVQNSSRTLPVLCTGSFFFLTCPSASSPNNSCSAFKTEFKGHCLQNLCNSKISFKSSSSMLPWGPMTEPILNFVSPQY